jgi:hypothetical protein
MLYQNKALDLDVVFYHTRWHILYLHLKSKVTGDTLYIEEALQIKSSPLPFKYIALLYKDLAELYRKGKYFYLEKWALRKAL